MEKGDGRQRAGPFTMVGDDFQAYVDKLVAEIRQMSKDIGVIQ
ncbi:hypothetical protein [Jhaorihella thermophila]